jgi:hypothetical protein
VKSLSLIHNYVWSKRYLGLFDYEAQEVQKRRYKVEGNATVLKDSDKIIMLDEKMEKLTKGLAEVLTTSPSTTKTQFSDSSAATTTIRSCPLSTRRRLNLFRNRCG